MYAPGTILQLKEPRSTDENKFPYDEVEVIGESPIHHGIYAEEWVGANGSGVIVRPLTDFGTTLDEPFGKLQRLYSVKTLPPPVERQVNVRVIQQADLGPSPEDVFAEEAKNGDGRKVKQKERNTSPLPTPKPEPSNAALPDVEGDAKKPTPPSSPLD